MPGTRSAGAEPREPLDGRDDGARWFWIAFGLGTLTCSTLLLEIVITRIFSVVLVYHFAFMAVSLALFGIGLAGIFIYLYPERFSRRTLSRTTAVLALSFAVSTIAALGAFHGIVTTASSWPLSFGRVMSIFAVMAVPFFLSGMAVALPISRCAERIGFLYGADLCGAALGAALAIPVLSLVGGPMAVVVAACLASAAAVCFAMAASSRAVAIASMALASGCIALVAAGTGTDLFALRHSRFGPEDNLLFQKWNSFSRISVWGPYDFGSWWRLGQGAPNPAIAARERGTPTHFSVVIDGGAKTPMARFDGGFEDLEYFKYDVTALAYHARPARSALVIGSGAGRDILTARAFGVASIRAVEINPLIVDVTRRYFGDFSGDPYGLPGVDVTIADGRSFAAESTDVFDVVQLAAVDTFAASGGGALALVEHSLYTVQAFRDYHDRLSPEGLLSVTHKWGADAPQRALRAVDLVRRAWLDRGHPDVAHHVVVVGREFGWGTMLVSKRPFQPEEVDAIVDLARRLGFGILYAPGVADSIPEMEQLLGTQAAGFLRGYEWDVSATTDDRPFFFFFERPKGFVVSGLSELNRLPEFRRGAADEQNAPTLLVRLLVWMLGASLALVFLFPLALGRLDPRAIRGAGRILAYFASIGLGFILIEIPMIQRYTLLLGQPIYAFAVILGCMLVSSGIGSVVSGRISDEGIETAARVLLLLVAGAGAAHALLAPSLVASGLRWPLPFRLIATALTIAPLAFFMGFPMPLAIRMIERRAPAAIAWGWGINGTLSVVGSIVAMMISVTLGMTSTMLCGAAAYLFAAWTPTGESSVR